jgi:uncharacterized membrane protein
MKLSKYLHRAPRLWGRSRSNLDRNERLVSLALGAGLAALGLRRWKSSALALAATGLLLRRGVTGKCPLYRRLGLSSA